MAKRKSLAQTLTKEAQEFVEQGVDPEPTDRQLFPTEEKKAVRRKGPPVPVRSLTVRAPDDLHYDLRMHSVLVEESIQSLVVRWIREGLEKEQQE